MRSPFSVAVAAYMYSVLCSFASHLRFNQKFSRVFKPEIL